MITTDHIRLFNRFLNLCENDNCSPENDYKSVYRYKDGNNNRRQVTLGKGFTEDGGNLGKVLDQYFISGGTSEVLKSQIPNVGRGVLAGDMDFCKALSAASSEQAMKDAQDRVFLAAYLNPALAWAQREGFKLPLSYGVAVDSYLHSGKMSAPLVASFAEKTPAHGGDEKRWMIAYLNARKAWFTRSTGDLHTCIFRPKFFLGEIAQGNWNFDCPMTIPEKGKIC